MLVLLYATMMVRSGRQEECAILSVYIESFDKLSIADVERVGGKNTSLGEMERLSR